jgi:RNA polymerase-binding transcription factor DksA
MDTATQTHLRQLRTALLYQHHELGTQVHAARLARGEAPELQQAGDTKDLADRLQLEEVDEAQQRRDIEDLAATEAALQRLDSGAYGDCADCGEPIGLARLQVLPAALRCAACQTRHEHRPA